MLGRWQSNAYETYIRMPRQQLAALSKQLVTSHCNLVYITTSHCCNTTFVCILSLVMYFRHKNKKQKFFDWVAIWLMYLTGILVVTTCSQYTLAITLYTLPEVVAWGKGSSPVAGFTFLWPDNFVAWFQEFK